VFPSYCKSHNKGQRHEYSHSSRARIFEKCNGAKLSVTMGMPRSLSMRRYRASPEVLIDNKQIDIARHEDLLEIVGKLTSGMKARKQRQTAVQSQR
jgi:hypothetical protein